jgi:hypothetical protein
MSSSGDDSEDRAKTGGEGLETSGKPSMTRALARGDEPGDAGMLTQGTCEQPPLAREANASDASAQRSGEGREQGRGRDPAEVLRMWPCSMGILEDHTAVARAASPMASDKRHGDDKLGLAHFALDLYREIEDFQPAASDAHLARLVHPAHPVDPAQPVQPLQRDVTAVCDNPNCEVRINRLRSALVEACLLAQRMVMMTPATNGEVEGRIRELLELIDA